MVYSYCENIVIPRCEPSVIVTNKLCVRLDDIPRLSEIDQATNTTSGAIPKEFGVQQQRKGNIVNMRFYLIILSYFSTVIIFIQ